MLVDAHRHGSHYDADNLNLRGIPVHLWENSSDFLAFEHASGKLPLQVIKEQIFVWQQRFGFVGQVLDWSAKHNRSAVRNAYDELGIESFAPMLWSQTLRIQDPEPYVLILPDERFIGEACVEIALNALYQEKYLTVHAMQSTTLCRIGQERLGTSIVCWLDSHGLLTPKTILVHLNYASSEDMRHIDKAGSRVVLCPKTALALGNPIPEKLLDLNINIGTDAVTVTGTGSLIANAQALFWMHEDKRPTNNLMNIIQRALINRL